MVVLLLGTLVGCRTSPRVDWNSRIGAFSFDQAVIELGPPDRVAELTDGGKVAEWTTRKGYARGILFHGHPHRFGYGFYDVAPGSDQCLRLVFAPDHRLSSWRTVYK
jgi:hypothetical protein